MESLNKATLLIFISVCLSPLSASKLLHTSGEEPAVQEWPCPLAADIAPCTCTDVGSPVMDLDCSGATDEDQLRAALSNCAVKFPFFDMRDLKIEHSGIGNLTGLHSGVFCALTFESVYISGTKIVNIEESVFDRSHKTVLRMTFENNQIEGFPFETLPLYIELEQLSLKNNAITSLPDIQSNSLTYLNMDDNPNLVFSSTAFTGITQLSSLNLRNIGLQAIPAGALNIPTLGTLDLSNNALTKIFSNDIISDNALVTLSLNDNSLTELEIGSIVGASPGLVLKIANNMLKNLEETVFGPILDSADHNAELDIPGNPLRCGCLMKWVVDNPVNVQPLFTDGSTCYGGTQKISELPLEAFRNHCEE